ncbi:DUF7266 family protein [Halapricum hydrolyticum]|uniref:PKD domain-containing protein n=1 Tax=Halapricum hydrolyticum TaxID=2979991 RepID=A0AAE3I9B7_9EURY|nr:PKD domain-containing protein [Halapricum hydrolyticum]MCU4716593.1 PKD domain-containing protein [Halapricum hydrolyticum]MCU4725802.1 PKD domain-containing protein [Halapricum hydrolyticum]
MVDSNRQGGAKGQSLWGDGRGLSTPVTHVLTIAITGLVLIMLVSTASGFLSDQQEFAARDELDTIGNRLADDVQEVVALSEESGEATVSIEQPGSIVGHEYRVSYESDPAACDGATHATDTCLVMSVVGIDVSQTVPLSVPSDVSLQLSRSGSTFELTVEKTGTGSSRDAVVPMTRTMRVGVGQNINTNEYGEVIDPTNRPPIPKLTFAPDFPHSGAKITFDAAASRDPDGEIEEYKWYISESLAGSGQTYREELPPGQYNVTLLVEDDEGAQSIRTRQVRVSGLAYNEDLSSPPSSETRCNGVGAKFTMTNEWDYTVRVDHLSIDPPDNVNKIKNNRGPEVAFDLNNDGGYETGVNREMNFKNKKDGYIMSLRSRDGSLPITISSGDTVGVSVCAFNGGGDLKSGAAETTFGFRYWNRGTTNRTVIDPEDVSRSSSAVGRTNGEITIDPKSDHNHDSSSTGTNNRQAYDDTSRGGHDVASIE